MGQQGRKFCLTCGGDTSDLMAALESKYEAAAQREEEEEEKAKVLNRYQSHSEKAFKAAQASPAILSPPTVSPTTSPTVASPLAPTAPGAPGAPTRPRDTPPETQTAPGTSLPLVRRVNGVRWRSSTLNERRGVACAGSGRRQAAARPAATPRAASRPPKAVSIQGKISFGAGGMGVSRPAPPSTGDGGSGEPEAAEDVAVYPKAPKARKIDLFDWVSKQKYKHAWLDYVGERGEGRAGCTICTASGLRNRFTGTGPESEQYTDRNYHGVLTTTVAAAHQKHHEKQPAQQLAQAAPSMAGRSAAWVTNAVHRNSGGLWNIMKTVFSMLASGCSFRQIENVCHDVLPALVGTVDTSSLSGTDGDAVRCGCSHVVCFALLLLPSILLTRVKASVPQAAAVQRHVAEGLQREGGWPPVVHQSSGRGDLGTRFLQRSHQDTTTEAQRLGVPLVPAGRELGRDQARAADRVCHLRWCVPTHPRQCTVVAYSVPHAQRLTVGACGARGARAENFERVTEYLGIMHIKATKAPDIVGALLEMLGELDIDVCKYIAVGMDGCSTMLGCNGGVSTYWRQQVPFCAIRVAERTELCVNDN